MESLRGFGGRRGARAMSITFRIFIANGARLTPVSRARWTRLMEGEETVPYDANHEMKTIEVSVEVERRVMRRVVDVLPVRVPVDEVGKISIAGLVEPAINRMPSLTAPRTSETAIAELQRDASYFWPLEERHWQMLSQLLDLPVTALKRALHRKV
jgi:hypothetical protein